MPTKSIADTKKKINFKAFTPYTEYTERLIFPVHRWNAIDPETGDPLGKVPKVSWSNYILTEGRYENLIRTNHNLGFRIPENILVIDYDPRNDKTGDALNRLLAEFDIDKSGCPIVNTGGGGVHIYMKKPAESKIRKSMKAFKGIDFLSKGNYVVCAGSIHPNGRYYKWDDFCDNDLNSLTPAPKRLLAELDRKVVQNDLGEGDNWGEFTNEQLDQCLAVLPAEDFRGHDVWLRIMMAAHFMTGGDGFDIFQQWCETDETFIGSEGLHRNRWYSLSNTGRNGVGPGSIFKEITDRGSNWRECIAIDAEKDFESLDAELENILLDNTEEHNLAAGKLLKAALALDIDKMNATDIGRIYNKLDDIPLAVRNRILMHFTEKLRIEKGELNKYATAAKRADKELKDETEVVEDTARRLAKAVLKYKYAGNRLLFIDGTWWHYVGTHWVEIKDDSIIGRVVKNVLDKFRAKHNDISFGSETALIVSTIKMLEFEAAVAGEKCDMFAKPQSVINCLNGELWINDDGTTEFKDHAPKSLLTIAPTIVYDKKARSKLFKPSMRDTFKNFEDKEDMVRHVEELIGYMIQPKKDIDAFWLFKGPGGDGKTTLTEIIMGLVGHKACAVIDIESLSKDNHATSGLVGKLVLVDDDLHSNAKLDDSMMKKLSANKMLTANPKFKTSFNFVNTCQPIMCSNSYPRYSDLSRGLRRRLQIIPFNRQFDIDNTEIKNFAELLLQGKEASGVLNIVLKGLKRLRKRGRFKKPTSCKLEEMSWRKQANPIEEFMTECVELIPDSRIIDGLDLYNVYSLWYVMMFGDESRFKVSLRTFYQEMEQIGLKRVQSRSNSASFEGAILKEQWLGINEFDGEVND